jgi:anti-anti-sigma factor
MDFVLKSIDLRADSGGAVEYEFVCTDLTTVLDDLTAAVLVIGHALPLDETSLSRLRLCLYELGANAVEHGSFDGANPEIRVSLVIGDDCIVAKFSDNASAFSTLKGRRVDVADKIRRRSGRGLGLFLLNNITDGLSYERDGSWNRTRLIIRRDKDASCNLNRRTEMNELTITVTPTDCRDIVVVKPTGSVNSSTVPQLDASFNRLMQNGQTTIVVDLSETEFISSSGVGLLLATVSLLRDKGGDMLLMKLPKLVDDIFEVLNIKMHFRILGDLSELKAGARP